MASASSSRQTSPSVSSFTFPRARVQWVTKKGRKKQLDGWLCISTALRWVHIDSRDSATQVDLSSFRGQYCLSLTRLKESAVWEDVEEAVVPFDNGRVPGFAVRGKLTHPGAWRAKRRSVKLDIIFDTADERNAIMEQVRIRVAPWELLYRRMKEAMRDGKLSGKVLKDLFGCAENSTGTAEDHASAKSFPFVDVLEEGGKGLNALTGFLQAAATIVKKSAENSAAALSQGVQVVQDVTEYVKCVTIVSSVVQTLVIATKLAELYTEMKRGNKEWPRIYARIEDLRKVVVERIVSIMHLDGHVDEILVRNMFEVQEELVDVVAIVEEKLMRVSGPIEKTMQFWKAKELKKIENDLERLKGLMINVVQSSSIAQNSKLLKDMERDVEDLKQYALPISGSRKRNSSEMQEIKREVKKLKTVLEKVKQILRPPADSFNQYFDSPALPQNLVFDFESCDHYGSFITSEGILLNSVLQLGEQGNSQGASALGTHGMGGVGKTTSLKKICGEESVRSRFVDGICFMQFGQDATLQKVREEICRCVRNFGGKDAAKDMRCAPNLADVVNRAAEWLKCKAVLLVCDDLWATSDNELGYVRELKQMLRDAPKSGLLISTRDKIISQAVSSSPVNFECVEPLGPKAREILGRAAFGVGWEQIISNWDAKSELEYVGILKACAGLPLALGIAGSGVRANYVESEDGEGRKDASLAVKDYMFGLKDGTVKTLGGTNAYYHRDGLKYMIEASLKLCQAWGRTGGRNYDMGRLFRSLCILEKQQFLPASTLKLYWRFEGLDEMEVREVVRKFADLNLVKRGRGQLDCQGRTVLHPLARFGA